MKAPALFNFHWLRQPTCNDLIDRSVACQQNADAYQIVNHRKGFRLTPVYARKEPVYESLHLAAVKIFDFAPTRQAGKIMQVNRRIILADALSPFEPYDWQHHAQ